MKCLEKFKKDPKFAMLVLLGIALILMILFVILVGFTLWFWLFLVVWIAFFFRFKVLFAASFLTCVMIFLAFFTLTLSQVISGAVGKSSSSSGSALVPCTSTIADSPTIISGYKATMFAQPVDYSGFADSGVRTFSIKELDAKTGNDIFFRFERSDGSFMPGVKGLIEVCNSDNMTQKYSSTKDSTTTGASDKALAITYFMNGNDKITEPGTYRVDAYANTDGSWKLVGRTLAVTATK